MMQFGLPKDRQQLNYYIGESNPAIGDSGGPLYVKKSNVFFLDVLFAPRVSTAII